MFINMLYLLIRICNSEASITGFLIRYSVRNCLKAVRRSYDSDFGFAKSEELCWKICGKGVGDMFINLLFLLFRICNSEAPITGFVIRYSIRTC
jgi:hypothetical protein